MHYSSSSIEIQVNNSVMYSASSYILIFVLTSPAPSLSRVAPAGIWAGVHVEKSIARAEDTDENRHFGRCRILRCRTSRKNAAADFSGAGYLWEKQKHFR